jgi:hypothetical protein
MNEVVLSKESAISKIERIIQLHIDITLRDPDALACLNNDWMHLADTELQYFVKMRDDYEQNFRSIVQKGMDEGEIKNLNIEVIIFSTLSTLRTLYLWYGKKRSLKPKVLKSTMIQVLLHGIVHV